MRIDTSLSKLPIVLFQYLTQILVFSSFLDTVNLQSENNSDSVSMFVLIRGGICPSRQSRRECKIFASGVNFSIFTHFLCFFLLKLLKLGEIGGVKFLA